MSWSPEDEDQPRISTCNPDCPCRQDDAISTDLDVEDIE